MQENIFDSATPGQSLTDTPGNANWEHPPQFVEVEEAAEYIWDKLHKEQLLEQVITFLDNNIPVEAIARMILFGGFTEGKWTPDVAILLAEIVFNQIMAIGIKAKVSKMKLFIKDQGTNKFHQDFAKFKSDNKESESKSTDAKKFAKEVKKEIQPSGLMAKETE